MLTTSDFTGYYKLPFDNNSKAVVEDLIQRKEFEYLVALLGYTLYLEFINDLGSNPEPTQQKFKDIFGYLFEKDNVVGLASNGGVMASSGIKDMMKGIVYYHFANEFSVDATQVGFKTNKNENSESLKPNIGLEMIEDRYNKAIDNYKAIQSFIKNNLTIYPTFDGVDKNRTYWGGAFWKI